MADDRPQGSAQQPVQIQIVLDDQVANGVYANMAMVNHNETEFILDFIFVHPQVPKATVRSRVVTSPKHLKRLLGALQENLARYETQFGKVDVSGPPPGLPFH
jgi:hypothetical protein